MLTSTTSSVVKSHWTASGEGELSKSALTRPAHLPTASKRPTSIKNLISFFESTYGQSGSPMTAADKSNPRLRAATMMMSEQSGPSVKETRQRRLDEGGKGNLGRRHLSMFVSPAYEASLSPAT